MRRMRSLRAASGASAGSPARAQALQEAQEQLDGACCSTRAPVHERLTLSL